LLFLLVSIGRGYYPMGGDYGKKDLENANRKAPGEADFPLEPFRICGSSGFSVGKN